MAKKKHRKKLPDVRLALSEIIGVDEVIGFEIRDLTDRDQIIRLRTEAESIIEQLNTRLEAINAAPLLVQYVVVYDSDQDDRIYAVANTDELRGPDFKWELEGCTERHTDASLFTLDEAVAFLKAEPKPPRVTHKPGYLQRYGD